MGTGPTPEAAGALIGALPEQDRALRVERSIDDHQEVGETKGRLKRTVPIPSLLRQRLREHLMRTGHRGDEFLFAGVLGGPFSPTQVTARADKAWKDAGLERVTLHEARHCYASYMIAAGCNVKALSSYMGHANINITLDTYGHMLPGNEAEAADFLDAYLSRTAAG